MVESPTTLEEIRKYPFLGDRLHRLVQQLVCHPTRTVLWIGAGLSTKFARLPTWGQFLTDLLSQVTAPNDAAVIRGLIESGRLTLAAECLQDILGDSIEGALISTFGGKSATLPNTLGYLCCEHTITTNYDLLLEQVMPWAAPLSPSDTLEKLCAPGFKLVKIHGSIQNPASCVLSLSSYVRTYTTNLHWYLVDLFSMNSVVFLGSSMNSSEPFFRTLRLLRQSGRPTPRHYAVKAVKDSRAATEEGKRLKAYGIELIPYVPDLNHSFLDSLLSHIDEQRGSPQAVHHRIAVIRALHEVGRHIDCAVHLWNLCHANISQPSDRRALADAVATFFGVLDTPLAERLVERCNRLDISIANMWLRMWNLRPPSHKAITGLERALASLEKITRTSYPLHRRLLSERRGDLNSPPPIPSASA